MSGSAEQHLATPDALRPILHVGLASQRGLVPDSRFGGLGTTLLEAIATTTRATAETGEPGTELFTGLPVLRLFSTLSNETARLWAGEAERNGFELCAVLPGLREQIAATQRTEAERVDFSELCRSAAAVFEIDDAVAGLEGNGVAAATIILDQCDLLILLRNDRAGARHPGGSTWLLRQAQERSLPVIVVSLDAAQPIIFRNRGTAWQAALETEIKRILLVPSAAAGSTHDAASGAGEVRSFLADTARGSWAATLFRGYERLLAVGSAATLRPGPGANPATVNQSPAVLSRQEETDRLPVQERIDPLLRHADELASAYASSYRIAGVLRITLGFVAMLGLFLAFYFADLTRDFNLPFGAQAAPGNFGTLAQGIGFGLDVAAIFAVLLISFLSDRRSWHSRFVAYRSIAENLRQMPGLALVGGTVEGLSPAPSGAGPEVDWPGWYIRTASRSVGLVSARVTPSYLGAVRAHFDHLVDDQIAFYSSRARKFDVIARRLWWLANACYWLSLIAVISRLVFTCCGLTEQTKLVVSIACLVFPSLAPIFLGLRSQGEYPKLAQRYAAMAATLRATVKELDESDLNFTQVGDTARRTAAIMLEEVSEWRSLIKAREISRM